jgi:hypothetical protein
MSSEPLLSSIIPLAGSGLLGYAMGFALKKILKWMLIIISDQHTISREQEAHVLWYTTGNDEASSFRIAGEKTRDP